LNVLATTVPIHFTRTEPSPDTKPVAETPSPRRLHPEILIAPEQFQMYPLADPREVIT
jgi:hypothetical protein